MTNEAKSFDFSGILGGIIFTNKHCITKDILQGACELACGCKGAVDAVTAILNGTTQHRAHMIF